MKKNLTERNFQGGGIKFINGAARMRMKIFRILEKSRKIISRGFLDYFFIPTKFRSSELINSASYFFPKQKHTFWNLRPGSPLSIATVDRGEGTKDFDSTRHNIADIEL